MVSIVCACFETFYWGMKSRAESLDRQSRNSCDADGRTRTIGIALHFLVFENEINMPTVRTLNISVRIIPILPRSNIFAPVHRHTTVFACSV